MTLRHWHRQIGILAVLAVLLHAGLLVRHHIGSIANHLANQELAAALGVICHGNGGSSTAPGAEAPALPPSNHGADCPLCAMGGGVAILLPDRDPPPPVASPVAVRLEIVAEILTQRLVHLRPPTRGPPQNV